MDEYRTMFAIYSRDYLLGYFNGYRNTIAQVYPDIAVMFSTDPDATEVVCRAVALERLLEEKK